jgi:hypothetical protein
MLYIWTWGLTGLKDAEGGLRLRWSPHSMGPCGRLCQCDYRGWATSHSITKHSSVLASVLGESGVTATHYSS